MNDATWNLRSLLDNRWLLCVGCNAVTSFLVYVGKLDSGSFTAITLGTVGAYIAGGAFERAKELKAQTESIK